MSYLALARRYRPADFNHILSQKHITKTLANAIATGRIAHAYLFCGPRGTGKTSTARVLAKSLNCKKGPTSTPCGECSNCLEIKLGNSPDVLEIDAASNRGIDDIRELRENVRYSPVASRYKIYIIDEVHRLTGEAFDALLKTLEEPPAHVIFMFATTEPQALPATILSRTQRYDFKRVPVGELAETVNNIASSESVEIEPKAALLVARKADGSLRDALSLLDQLINFSQSKITAELTAEVLGIVKTDFLFEIFAAIFKHDTALVLAMFNLYFNEGGDIDELASEVSSFVSRLMMIKNGVRDIALLEMDNAEIEKAGTLITDIDTSDLLRMLKVMADFIAEKKSGIDPVVAIEVALTRLANLDKSVDIDKLLSSFGNSGGFTNQPRTSTAPSSPKKPDTQQTSFSPARTKPSYNKPPASSPDKSALNNNGSQAANIVQMTPHKLEEVSVWWPEFLAYVKDNSRAIWSNLQHATAEFDTATNNIKICLSGGNDFHLNFLAKNSKNAILERLKEFSGTNPAISFVKVNGISSQPAIIPNGNGVPAESNGTEKPNGSSLTAGWQGNVGQAAEEFLSRHPQSKKLHDLIDGEDIGFRGSI